MSATREVKFSEAEVRRQAADLSVRDLRDPRHPGLYLRFWSNRERGTWHLVRGKKWVPVARWPELSVAAVLAELPALRQRLLREPATALVVSSMATVGQLLDWYGDRMARDRSLSVKRKAGARSAIAQHLKPRLDDMVLTDVTADTLDKQLMWPAQAEVSLSYLRQMFALLLTAFKQAKRLGLIESDPMAGMRFSDFTKAKILPKASRLHVRGELTPGNPQSEALKAAMIHGTVGGMSVGFSASKQDVTSIATGYSFRNVARLTEISVCTFPANESATVSTLKSMDTIESIRDAENWLRESAGLSKSEAQAFIARIKSAVRSESEGGDDIAALLERINTFPKL